MRDFRKYEVWHLAHALVLEVYTFSGSFPKSEVFGLTGQLRRAAFSIPANICEGCGRSTDREFARFLHIALGSSSETEYFLQLVHDLGYLDEEAFHSLHIKVNEIKRKLYHLEQRVGR